MSDAVEIRGLDRFIVDIEDSPDKLERSVLLRARKLAEQVAGQARQGAPVEDGRLRNSLQSFTEERNGEIVGGVRTSYDVAIFHELGTGPVGSAHPHPAEAQLHPKRRPNGWWYFDDAAVGQPLPDTIQHGKRKGKPRTPPGQVSNGLIYTEGVPAKAFMYNALKASEDEIMESLGGALEAAMNAEDGK